MPVLPVLPALLAVAACGSHPRDVDRLDRDLLNAAAADTKARDAVDNAAGNAADKPDPALTSALADQIMVDPALVQQANDHSVRPGDASGESPLPPGLAAAPANPDRPTLGELARRHAAGRGRAQAADCYATLSYSQRWATRLPAAVPLPADAAVSEAAGSDAPGCRTRVVSFVSAAPPARLAAFYVRYGKAAGYDAAVERRRHETVVAGDHPADDRAFFVTLAPRPDGGSDVDIVSNDGR